jgi:hypothetical protein
MCVSDFTVATIVVIFGTTNTNFQAKTITEAVTVTVPAATLHITIMVPEESTSDDFPYPPRDDAMRATRHRSCSADDGSCHHVCGTVFVISKSGATYIRRVPQDVV